MTILRLMLLCVCAACCTGCPGAKAPPAAAPVADAPAADHAESPAPEPTPPAADPQPEKPLEREARFVDRKVFLEQHPNANEIEKNVINAKDPISAVAQGYFAAVSKLTIDTLQYDLRLWYQLNGERWPSFAEYQEILEKHNVKLKGLKPRQVYAYDDKTGQLSIMELPEGESLD